MTADRLKAEINLLLDAFPPKDKLTREVLIDEISKRAEQYAELKAREACSCEKQEEVYEPYFGWCDVEGCENEGCCGGSWWREYGYWTLCYRHSAMARKGEPFPQMKLGSIVREKSRDPETGFLPINAPEPKGETE